LTARQVGKTTTAALAIAHAMIFYPEAARLPEDLIAALRPMRARKPQARLAMLSTAFTRSDPFWTAWAGNNPDWIRLKVTIDTNPELFSPQYLEQERRELGGEAFNQEYRGIPGGTQMNPFTWDLFERATKIHVPKALPGPAFSPSPPPPAVPVANPFRTLNPLPTVRG
jgi:hypothetical protein